MLIEMLYKLQECKKVNTRADGKSFYFHYATINKEQLPGTEAIHHVIKFDHFGIQLTR